jgi:hypothetical protein
MWSVHYQTDGVAGLRLIGTLRQAINEAFRLIERGDIVSQIEGHGGLNGMTGDEILTAYVQRKSSRVSSNLSS